MFKILLLFIPLALCQQVEFSTRPNNVSILLIYFTQRATDTPTILSPIGLWSLMAGISFSATGNTYRQIFRTFLLLTDKKKFTDQYKAFTNAVFKEPTSGVRVHNKNYYFLDTNEDNFQEKDYQDFLKDNFDTSALYLDFNNLSGAAQRANEYVKIQSAPVQNVYNIEDFRGSSLIIGNVIYFQGVWTLPFNSSYTKQEPVQNGSQYVTMMSQRAKVPYSHLDIMKASVTELSYGNDGKYSMLIITPDPNVPIIEVYKKFEKVTLRYILNKLEKDINDFGLTEVDIKLPRFRKQSYYYLQRPLNDMGIYDAFEPEFAFFPRLARVPIYIESIEQKTDFYITETGTVAYATTPGRGNLINSIDDVPPQNMVIFVVEKTTATILFGGLFP